MNAPVPDPETVPEELREREQWLMFDSDSDTPRRPHWRGNFSVSWNDPNDWHSFEEAVEAASERESWGIGFVFAASNDDHARGLYGVLDLDGCVGEDGRPKEWLPALQPFFDAGAYMERSPSGEGIHIPLAGLEKPEWWSDSHFTADEHEGVEVLTSKFCTFTGDQLRNSGETVGDTGEFVDEWLTQAFKSITGDDPHESTLPDASGGSSGEYSGDGLTPEQAADALECIDPNVGYPTWRDVGFALADEYSDSRALSLFTDWSRSGSAWDDDAPDLAERIIEDSTTGGGRTMGTVARLAQENGWSHPGGGQRPTSEPTGESSESASADGGTAVESGDSSTTGPSDSTDADALTPLSVMAVAGLGEDDSLADLTDREKAYYVHRLIDDHADEHLLATTPDGTLFHYDGGVWDSEGEQRLRELGDRALGPAYSKNVFRELKERVRASAAVPREDMGAPRGTVAVEKGLLDLETRELRDLRPDDHALFQVDAPFDPDADCPRFREFVGEVVRPDDIDTLQEYAGYTLLHWGQPYKRAVLLLGPQDSGKSTFLSVVRTLLGGRDNVSAENLNSLVNERFGKANLYGKVANVTNELETKTLQSVGLFKTLTGGGDPISAEFKGKDKFDFVPTAKQLFATNQVPPTQDADGAFYSRWLFVTFPQSVPANAQIRDLDEQLLADERAGILNWMLEGYSRLHEQDGFSNDPLSGAKRERWEAYGNSIQRFKQNCLEVTGDADDVVAKSVTHDFYSRYCREKAGTEVETQSKLTRELKKDESIGDGRRKVHPDDKRRTAYTGVKYHPDALDTLDFDSGAKLAELRGDHDDTEGEHRDANLHGFDG